MTHPRDAAVREACDTRPLRGPTTWRRKLTETSLWLTAIITPWALCCLTAHIWPAFAHALTQP